MSEMNPRRRTILSFSVLGALAAVFGGFWCLISAVGEDSEDTSPFFRRVLEFNGRFWSPPSDRETVRPDPPPGKIPRVNGDIGLDGDLNVANWKLEVESGSGQTFNVALSELQSLPRTRYSTEFRCVEGWSEEMSFTGVRFSDFMAAFKIEPKKYVGLVSVNGEYYVSIDMESMRHRQTMLAYEMNGQGLRAANGAPLRLVIPIKYGIKNLKQIGKIFFSDERPADYWAERGYDWYAGL